MFLLNAFSLNMVKVFPAAINVTKIESSKARSLLHAPEECWGGLGHCALDPLVTCAVGHADTASLFAA